MDIKQEFVVRHPAEAVWKAFSDVNLVASCIPGAEITEIIDDTRQRGRMNTRLGPLSASFSGETKLTLDAATMTGTVEGSGIDQRSSSRAAATMNFAVESDGPQASRVTVQADVRLAGALAQFGRSSVIEDIAAKITEQFAANLQARLDHDASAAAPDSASAPGGHAAASPHPPAPSSSQLSLFPIIVAVIKGWFRNLFGGRRAG